jgi:hypothetical protein
VARSGRERKRKRHTSKQDDDDDDMDTVSLPSLLTRVCKLTIYDAGSMPMLDSNVPHPTLDCSTLQHSTRTRHCNPVTFLSRNPSSRRSTVERWPDADARRWTARGSDTRLERLMTATLQPRYLSTTSPVLSTIDSQVLARRRCSTRAPHARHSTFDAQHSDIVDSRTTHTVDSG